MIFSFVSGPRRRRLRAFTLVEMLVAVAVISIMLGFLAEVISLTGLGISLNDNKLDAVGQARLFFDRLAVDLAARPDRTDLPMLFNIAPGNDSFCFYSQTDGYDTDGTSPLSLVSYQILTTPKASSYQLERGTLSCSAKNPISFSVTWTPATVPVISPDNYDILGSEIFRMEVCFLLNNGVLTCNSPVAGQPTTAPLPDFSNVTGLVVAVAVLDANSRLVLGSTPAAQSSGLAALADALPDAVNGTAPLTTWTTLLDSRGPAFAPSVPTKVAQNVRLFQRIFYVH